MKETQSPFYCAATHPKQPNYSGHSRGRKLHLSIDGKKSICNMKYEKLTHSIHVSSMAGNGQCKVCFAKYPEMKF